MSLKQVTLHEEHIALGAKMVPFAGYSMPIQYKNLKEEVLAVRNNVGMFDVSHMGEFFVEGSDAEKFVNYLVTNDITGVGENKAIYSPLCREDATIIDDLIVYKLAPQKIMICVNASNMEKDWNWIESKKDGFDVSLRNESDNISLLAIQGPKAHELLTNLNLLPETELDYYSAFEFNETIVARTGYTGEDGYEIFASHAKTKNIWKQLLNAGVEPCGLGSRDVLRIEVGFPLYGQDIHDDVTPYDSGLKWTVKLGKEDFIGKQTLESLTPKFKFIKLELEKGIPRPGYEVLDDNLNKCGVITSGTMSVILGKGVAMAHVNRDVTTDKYIVNIRNKHYDAVLKKGPFVQAGRKK